MKASIKDVARESGVSIGTVSRVVGKRGFGYSKQTEEKVLKAIKKLNYIPNQNARSLVTKSTKTIGILIPNISNLFFSELVKGAEKYCRENGYLTFICVVEHDVEEEKRIVNTLSEKAVDGMIFTNKLVEAGLNDDGSNIPTVYMDAKIENNTNSVFINVDNVNASKSVISHLNELGHESILVITGQSTNVTTINRTRGVNEQCSEIGMSVDYIECDYTYESAYELIQKVDLSAYTAIYAYNDLMALGIMKYFYEKGGDELESISLVGFDDIETASIVSPGLTTVKQPAYEMGYAAAKKLVKLINGLDVDKEVTFETKLIVRESTKRRRD